MTRKLGRQIILFVLVGGVQFLLDMSIFIVLVYNGGHVFWSNAFSRFSAAVVGFILNRNMTFKGGRQGWRVSFVRFCIWWLTVTCLGGLLLWLVEITLNSSFYAALAKFVLESLIVLVSFYVYRVWVYLVE